MYMYIHLKLLLYQSLGIESLGIVYAMTFLLHIKTVMTVLLEDLKKSQGLFTQVHGPSMFAVKAKIIEGNIIKPA